MNDTNRMIYLLHERLRTIDLQILRANELERETFKELAFTIKEQIKALESSKWPRGYLK